ncbi:MAG: GatB/YqeY domain-containing protein [Firmicutes bacterium]|nr:GatB/YqeY domain-containing protein [Bacillota bacterium]
MSIKDRLTQEMKDAMKAKDSLKLTVIRLIKSEVKNTEIDKKKELSDDEVMDVIQKEVKKRKESITEFQKGNRQDLVDKQEAELKLLVGYLPAQADEEEIRRVIKEIVDAIPAGEKIVIGKIMPKALAALKGKADGKRVSAIAQEFV